MAVGGGLECRKSHRMDAFVGLTVGTPLGPLASCMRGFQEGSGIAFEQSDAIPKTLPFGQELVRIKAAFQRNMHYQLLRFCIKHYVSSLQSDYCRLVVPLRSLNIVLTHIVRAIIM